jgi:hypothetical protein
VEALRKLGQEKWALKMKEQVPLKLEMLVLTQHQLQLLQLEMLELKQHRKQVALVRVWEQLQPVVLSQQEEWFLEAVSALAEVEQLA